MNTLHFVRFTVAYWCLLAAALLPYVCAGIAKSGLLGKPRNQGGFDNDHPRQWMARQTDWRARANAAQANSFEGLPFFMAAVIIAHQLGAAQTLLDILAFLYVLTRVVYITMYVGGLSSARSAAWEVGMLLNLVILFIGYH